jgi:hypothetical protein
MVFQGHLGALLTDETEHDPVFEHVAYRAGDGVFHVWALRDEYERDLRLAALPAQL